MDRILAIEKTINKRLAIVHWYQGWGPAMQPDFDLSLFQTVREHGSVPLVTWEPWNGGAVDGNPFPLRRIAAGAYDAYIDSWALGMRGYGGPVLLVFAHEMQGNWYPWGAGVHGNTPADYVAAYRHVHDRFVKAAVHNVQWVWTPAADPEQAFPPLDRFYPGDDYIDWLGVDVYNDAAAQYHHSWRSLSQLLAPAYHRLAALNQTKPMMLVEWASVEKGGDKAAWIRDAGRTLARQFPRVRAAVWFSSDSEDLRIDSSTRAATGARSAFSSAAFCASLTSTPPGP